MTQFSHLDHRRTQHTGVLSDGRWSAHARRTAPAVGAAGATPRGSMTRRLTGATSPRADRREEDRLMWFWECPKRGCPFSAVADTEEAVRDDAVQHIATSADHEQWARTYFALSEQDGESHG